MSFIVNQGHDAVFSESYRSTREALTSNLEVEAAKNISKARLERPKSKPNESAGQGTPWGNDGTQGYRNSRGIWGSAFVGGTSGRADVWRKVIGSSKYEMHQVRFSILKNPVVPFRDGVLLGEIPKLVKDLKFGREDLKKGFRKRLYKKIGVEEEMEVLSSGKMVSSAFLVWQVHGVERKGRFVINFKRQRNYWTKGTVKVEKLPGFRLDLK